MIRMRKLFLALLFALPFMASAQNKSTLKPGKWYAEFAAQTAAIPFVFEVTNTASGTEVTLINGKERVELKKVVYKGDSVYISIEDYDTQLSARFEGDKLKGVFKRLFAHADAGVPFEAYHADRARFDTKGKADYSLQGKWDVVFQSEQGDKKNVGIFSEEGGLLTGSILTNSGDLRFLEGVTDATGFRLSAFAGLSPYLIEGKFLDANHFEGYFITAKGRQSIKGVRNQQAALSDPYRLTQLRDGYTSLNFKLPNLKNQLISLTDDKYRGKVVVVSILGSWCPNCLDEMSFLSPWYKANKERGVEVVGLAFERKTEPAYVQKVLSNLINKHQTTYDILVAGKIGDDKKVLPEIDGLKSYPTTIFIDKKGNVRKIHTGFNGPATGLFYDEFKSEFNKLVDELLAE